MLASENIPGRVIYPTGIKPFNRGMDIWEIRLINMRKLAEREGSVAALARKLDMSYPLLNNYVGKNPTKRLGDVPINRATDAFGLPRGWLDVPHLDEEEGAQQPRATAWPFAIERERFEALPMDEKERIGRFVRDTIEAWETTQLRTMRADA